MVHRPWGVRQGESGGSPNDQEGIPTTLHLTPISHLEFSLGTGQIRGRWCFPRLGVDREGKAGKIVDKTISQADSTRLDVTYLADHRRDGQTWSSKFLSSYLPQGDQSWVRPRWLWSWSWCYHRCLGGWGQRRWRLWRRKLAFFFVFVWFASFCQYCHATHDTRIHVRWLEEEE